MYLATLKEFQDSLASSENSPTFKAQLGSYLSQATSALETRLESKFALASRVSFFSFQASDLTNSGSTIALRLSTGFLTKDSQVVVRYATDKSMLQDEADGEVYSGKYIVDRAKGLIHLPKEIAVLGDFTVSVTFTSGFAKSGMDYKNVPAPIKAAAIAMATKLFYTTNKNQVGSRFNKYNPRVADQIIKDAYSSHERPRALMVWSAYDIESSL